MTLTDLICQSRFESPEQEAILNVHATAAWISSELSAVMAEGGITPSQYNVLRILRGRDPQHCTCSEIGERLLDRTPDVTRLLVRLEGAGLVHRERAEHDRRVVEVRITEAGLGLLASLDEPVRASMRRAGQHLTDAELATLSLLLERLRTDQV